MKADRGDPTGSVLAELDFQNCGAAGKPRRKRSAIFRICDRYLAGSTPDRLAYDWLQNYFAIYQYVELAAHILGREARKIACASSGHFD
jgi:hypothetical protein